MGLAAPGTVQGDGDRMIPSDPRLPALGDLFVETGAPELVGVAARAAGRDVDVRRAEVAYVRYRPTRTCTVLWVLPCSDGAELLVSAKIFDSEKGKEVLDRPRFRRRVEAARALGDGSVRHDTYLADKKLLLTVFPLDVRLRGLPMGLSEPWARENLLPSLGLSDRAVIEQVRPLSYKPWRRCVLRYDISDGGRKECYYAKVFRDDRGRDMPGRMSAVGDHLRRVNSPWEITLPSAYLDDARLLVFPAVSRGAKIKDLMKLALSSPQAREELMDRIEQTAHGLADFQRADVEGLAQVTPADLVAKFKGDLGRIGAVAQDLSRSVGRRLEDLARVAGELDPEPLVPTHGAFRHGQLLLCADRLVVFDLDTLCVSGRSADAGNFLAYLDLLALRKPKYQAIAGECAEKLAAVVSESTGASAAWLGWYRGLSLVKIAVRSFYSLVEGWPARTEAVLARCDAATGCGGR